MEDAMIINKGSYDRGFAHGSIYKSEVISWNLVHDFNVVLNEQIKRNEFIPAMLCSVKIYLHSAEVNTKWTAPLEIQCATHIEGSKKIFAFALQCE